MISEPRQATVSVVIPFYNAAGTLAATIASATAQADVDLDVVAVDDGSTDNSPAVARSFGPTIRVFSGPNRGVSAARNRGIAETRGEWIIFLDADDVLLPGTVRMRLDAAEATAADVVICDWQDVVDQDGRAVAGRAKSVDIAALTADAELACARHIWATTAALMYRRPLVKRIGGFRNDLPVIQDARFLFDAAFNGARFARSPHIGAQYRVLPESLSRRDPLRFWRDVFTNAKQIEALWRTRGMLSVAQRAALAEIYDHTARVLFASGQPDYFEAVECQRKQGRRLTLHPGIAAPLARTLGLNRARRVFKLLGR